MAEEQQPLEQIQPQDPQYQVDKHVALKRAQETANKYLKSILKQSLSQFELVMDGTTYAYTKLSLINKSIEEINELIWEYPHLRYLQLYFRKIQLTLNRINNLNALLKLKYLTYLDASKNIIADIKFICNPAVFPYLHTLNLSSNQIKQLYNIKLNNLKYLNLSYNQIQLLDQFNHHPKLEILQLKANKISTLHGFTNFQQLQQIYLAQNNLTNLNGINQMPKLTKLHLRKNKISQLTNFPNINPIYLNLRENIIAKIDDIKGIPQSVRILNLLANPISQQLGDNAKKQIYMKYKHYDKINKQQIPKEQKDQFDKQYKDRLAEQQRERLEKQALERQAAQKQAQGQQ